MLPSVWFLGCRIFRNTARVARQTFSADCPCVVGSVEIISNVNGDLGSGGGEQLSLGSATARYVAVAKKWNLFTQLHRP